MKGPVTEIEGLETGGFVDSKVSGQGFMLSFYKSPQGGRAWKETVDLPPCLYKMRRLNPSC